MGSDQARKNAPNASTRNVIVVMGGGHGQSTSSRSPPNRAGPMPHRTSAAATPCVERAIAALARLERKTSASTAPATSSGTLSKKDGITPAKVRGGGSCDVEEIQQRVQEGERMRRATRYEQGGSD